MRNRCQWPTLKSGAAGLVVLAVVTAPAWGQQRASSSSSAKEGEPVVRKFGNEGSYRTEVSSRTIGKLTEEDRRQASLLTAEVFQHIEKAREAIDADDSKGALKDVNKAREAIKAVRAMLPKTDVHTRTLGPDGKVIYEDESTVQDSRVPLFEGMLHTETLAPILASRRNALEIAGFHVVQAESIITEAIADLDPIDAQLTRAAKALEQGKTETASKALAMALVRGIDIRSSKEDSELASARDAVWLARRSLEENNVTQAMVNLAEARQRLLIYRQLLSQDQRQQVDQTLREIEQLEGQLRLERTQPVTVAERARQGATVTHWWDRINSWFRRHL